MVLNRSLHEEAVLLIAPWIYKAILPYLYEKLQWTWQNHNHQSASLRLLVRSLLLNQELSILIKHIDFVINSRHIDVSSRPGEKLRPDLDEQLLSDDEVSRLKDVVRSTGLPADEWFPLLRRASSETLLSLLLTQTRRLRTLRLESQFHTESRLLGSMLSVVIPPRAKSQASEEDPFSQLAKVKYVSHKSEWPMYRRAAGFHHIQSLFHLPSIEFIEATLEERTRAFQPFRAGKSRPCASTLRTLILKRSEPRLDILEDLISVAHNLETVAFQWWADLDRAQEKYIFDMDSFLSALSPVKNSLKKLKLSICFSTKTFDIGIGTGWYGIELSNKAADLHTFKKLHRLELPILALLGNHRNPDLEVPALPASLGHLCVTNDAYDLQAHDYHFTDVAAALGGMLADRKSRAPNLETITIKTTEELAWGFDYDDLQSEAFKTTCGEAGVECNFVVSLGYNLEDW